MDQGIFGAFQAQGCHNAKLQDTASCWPPATISAPDPPYSGWGAYSPGIVCPSDYFSACGAGIASLTEFNFQFPLIAKETAIGCCPECVKTLNYPVHTPCGIFSDRKLFYSGFTCSVTTSASSFVQTCVHTTTSGSYSVGYCPASDAAVTDSLTSFQYITVPGTNLISFATGTSTATSTKIFSTAYLFAPMFQINWQSSDLSAATTSSSTSPSSSSTAVGLVPSPSPGLSTGAKAVIGVVIPVVVLIAIVLGFWFLRRRRRSRNGQGGPGSAGPFDTSQVQEHFAPATAPPKRSELDGALSRQEMETPHPELVGDGHEHAPQELAS